MGTSSPTTRVLRFGIFELDTQSGELRRQGLKIRLPDQSFQILRLLLEHPGEVVTREELRQQLWTSDTTVDFDVGLNSAIRKLRDALDDSADNPTFIETLPRRGYRFIASMSPATDQVREPGVAAAAGPRSSLSAPRIAGGLLLVAICATLIFVSARAWWGRMPAGTAAGQIRSIAVLPFDNLTGDPAQDYFVDGMTDALTTDLAKAGGFDVIPRFSAMQYKHASKPLPVIGRELSVDALVAGAIVRSGQHIRVTAQLIQAATDRHVWAGSYDGEVSDVVALQQKIARAVASAIGGRRPSPPARAGGPRVVNPEAYDAYLKGLSVTGRPHDGFRTAVAYFKEAVGRQPDFAEAHAALASAQMQFLFGGPLSPREVVPPAEASARKAMELDDTLASPHRTLGTILHNFYWQWEEGDKELRRAAELKAGPADPPEGVGALAQAGRFQEAIVEAERARKLDPLSFNAYVAVAGAYRAAGQYDRAIEEFRRALEMAPAESRGHFQLGVTFIMMGRLNDAIGELETAVTSTRGNSRYQAYLGYAYAAAGRPLDARRILKELESLGRRQYISAFGLALIHDALGEREPALAAIERAYQDHAIEFALFSQYPPFRTLSAEPRYQTIIRRAVRARGPHVTKTER